MCLPRPTIGVVLRQPNAAGDDLIKAGLTVVYDHPAREPHIVLIGVGVLLALGRSHLQTPRLVHAMHQVQKAVPGDVDVVGVYVVSVVPSLQNDQVPEGKIEAVGVSNDERLVNLFLGNAAKTVLDDGHLDGGCLLFVHRTLSIPTYLRST